MRSTIVAVLACASLACSTARVAELPSTALRIDGDVPARTLAIEDLQRLGPVDVEWTHKGESHRYEAVPMETLLRAVGVDPDAGALDAAGAKPRPSDKKPA